MLTPIQGFPMYWDSSPQFLHLIYLLITPMKMDQLKFLSVREQLIRANPRDGILCDNSEVRDSYYI